MNYARLVFENSPKRDCVLWNVPIRGYAMNGPCEEALLLYSQMRQKGIQPDELILPFILKGMKVHHFIIRAGLDCDLFVGNALLALYAKCGSIENARQVFNKMCERDLVSWNSMIVGYSQNGHAYEALTLFHQMLLEEVVPGPVTMVSVLRACT